MEWIKNGKLLAWTSFNQEITDNVNHLSMSVALYDPNSGVMKEFKEDLPEWQQNIRHIVNREGYEGYFRRKIVGF